MSTLVRAPKNQSSALVDVWQMCGASQLCPELGAIKLQLLKCILSRHTVFLPTWQFEIGV